MDDGKPDMFLAKALSITYWIIFVVFVLCTRTPNYFTDKKTTGTVVGISESHSKVGSKTDTYRQVVFSYMVDTTSYTISDPDGSYITWYSKGDKVTVVYDEEDPNRVGLPATFGYWIKVSEIFIAFLIYAILALMFNGVTNPKAS